MVTHIQKSREFLESYAKKLSEKQHDTKENIETNDLLKDSSLRGLHEFINVYTSKMEVYDYDIEFLQKRLRGNNSVWKFVPNSILRFMV